jgi:hypothetical protein
MTQDEMVELAKQANFVWLTPDVRTLILLAVAKEREACAKMCEKQDAFNPLNYPEICAKAIRARGEA